MLKNAQKCNIFSLMEVALYSYRRVDVTLRLSVFEIFAVKWLFRGQKTDPLSLSWLRIWIPLKLWSSKMKKTHLGRSSTILWNFTLIGGTNAEISVLGHRKKEKKHLEYFIPSITPLRCTASTVRRERKHPSTPKFQTKVTRDSNPDCRRSLNPEPDADFYRISQNVVNSLSCRRRIISPSFVLPSIPYSAVVKKMEKWIRIWVRSSTKSSSVLSIGIGLILTSNLMKSAHYFLSNPAHKITQTEKTIT